MVDDRRPCRIPIPTPTFFDGDICIASHHLHCIPLLMTSNMATPNEQQPNGELQNNALMLASVARGNSFAASATGPSAAAVASPATGGGAILNVTKQGQLPMFLSSELTFAKKWMICHSFSLTICLVPSPYRNIPYGGEWQCRYCNLVSKNSMRRIHNKSLPSFSTLFYLLHRSPQGDCFVIKDSEKFTSIVLPQYFKHS